MPLRQKWNRMPLRYVIPCFVRGAEIVERGQRLTELLIAHPAGSGTWGMVRTGRTTRRQNDSRNTMHGGSVTCRLCAGLNGIRRMGRRTRQAGGEMNLKATITLEIRRTQLNTHIRLLRRLARTSATGNTGPIA